LIRLPLNRTFALVYALSRVAQTGWSKGFFSNLPGIEKQQLLVAYRFEQELGEHLHLAVTLFGQISPDVLVAAGTDGDHGIAGDAAGKLFHVGRDIAAARAVQMVHLQPVDPAE
jgi:hypothetical protein